mgnify:CR=1 FL=1|tara:strand:+ start:486 stop:1535 length:1050 start_codon:yes stop_codon:yes gene_type:complete
MNINHKSVINKNFSILDAINIIDKSHSKIAVVLDENNKLIGTITDGDIRRAILNKAQLDSNVQSVMNKNCFFINSNFDEDDIKKKMISKGISYVPIVDKNKHFVDLLCLNELTRTKLNNDVVIMAGGKGTRLRPFTENCPKPMLKICGKPILELILENCIEAGFQNFYFSVNYLKENIINHFENGSKWNVNIEYLIENKELGTAGSLTLYKSKKKDPLLVLNGDVLTKIDFRKIINFHNQHNLNATMAVREESFTIPFGVVTSDGINIIGFEEKPTITKNINAGIYLLSQNVLSCIESDKYCDMPNLFRYLQTLDMKVGVFPIYEYWIDIGRKETLEKAILEWPQNITN